MKTWKTLNPRARKITAALALIAIAFPAPIATALHHTNLSAVAVIAAITLLLRALPAGSHRTLTAARIPTGIATAVTGHTPPAPTPDRTIAHAPSTGPQLPVTNPVR